MAAAAQKPGWTRSIMTFLFIMALGGYMLYQSRGCQTGQSAGPPAGARVVDVKIAGWPLQAEVADTPELRLRGLQGRQELPPGYGMLFVFEEPTIPEFWMMGTSIPLSIAFMKSDGTITKIAQMQPNELRRVSPDEPVSYALELRQGWFEDHPVKPGDKAELPETIPPPPPPETEGPPGGKEPMPERENEPAEGKTPP